MGKINADNTKCTVMSGYQAAGGSHSMKTDNYNSYYNSSFGMVERFKHLGATLTNQNSILEEIKSRLKSGNTCYHAVQNFCILGCYPKI
jgi:hypothetical protein